MKLDPIRDRYYRPLEIAERWSNGSFVVVAVLSLAALAVDQAARPLVYNIVQVSFVLGVLAVFGVGIAARLYWAPRAEGKRRQDLLSNSFSVALTHEKTSGYYNNDQTNPVRRLGVSVLENSFFSKAVAVEMVKRERVKLIAYAVIWTAAVLNRSTDLAVIAIMAQAIFSEQVISRWMRLEWVRRRYELVFDGLYRLIQTTTNYNRDEFRVQVIEAFVEYEAAKAYGGITLSSRLFERLNPALSREWMEILEALRLEGCDGSGRGGDSGGGPPIPR